MVDFEEILDNPAFLILGGGGIAMELLGWLYSKRALDYSFPIWQLLIMMAGTLVTAYFFANKE